MMIKQKEILFEFKLLFIIHCLVYNNISVVGAMRHNVDSYLPTWEDLDTRPLPLWYDSAKIGILVNWGLHSVPALQDETLYALIKDGKYIFNVVFPVGKRLLFDRNVADSPTTSLDA